MKLLAALFLFTCLLQTRAQSDDDDFDLYSAEVDHTPAENICDVTVPVSIYCYCDSLVAEDATLANCWIFNVTTDNDPIWNLFATQPHLTELKINLRPEGRLTFIPERALKLLPRLSLIHIFYGEISTLFAETFPRLSQLRELNLANNQVQRIAENAFINLENLQSLSLAENRIETIQRGSLAGLKKLQVLRLSMNNISLIQEGVFVNLHDLSELDLSNNNIAVVTSETFIGLESLQTLILQNNMLEILGENTFKYAPMIRHLDLKSNRLQVVHQAALAHLQHLEYLNLQDNQIQHIDDSFFRGMTRILYLNLRNNKLETVTQVTFQPLMRNLASSNMTFHVENNPLQCGCELQWLHDLHASAKSARVTESLNRSTCINNRIPTNLLQSTLCPQTTTTTTTTTTTPKATTTRTTTTTTTPTTTESWTELTAVAAPKNLEQKSEKDHLQKDTVAQLEPTAITDQHQPGNSSHRNYLNLILIILASACTAIYHTVHY